MLRILSFGKRTILKGPMTKEGKMFRTFMGMKVDYEPF
jgi:hypothetical protein